jgi:uncharacterized membrane protein
MPDALIVLMRWLHFTSFVTLLGGILYARVVVAPSLARLSKDAAEALESRTAESFRPWMIASVIGLVVSGLYNIVTNPGHSVKYHMLLGVKLLLALHVFAVAFLIVQPSNPRRTRMMTGALISGLIVIAIAAYLRRIY